MADNDLEDGELSVSEPSNMNSGIDAHKPGNSSVPESSTRKKSAKKEVLEKKTKTNGKIIETVPKEMLLQGTRKGQLDPSKDKEERKNNINKSDAPAFYSANYKKVPCEFLKKGACTRGDQCTFSHDFEPTKSATICRFFLGNACDKGDNCPFSHEIDSYPCKFYFVRQCDKHTLCPFSHEDHRFFKGEKETNQFFEENSDFMQESLRTNGNAGKLTQKYLYYLDQRRQKNAAIEADKSQSVMIPNSLGGSAQLSNNSNAQDFVENRQKFGQIQYPTSNQNSSQQSRFIDNPISDNLPKYNNIPNNSHPAGFQGSNTGNPSINSLNDPRAQMMQRPPGSNTMNQSFVSNNYNNQQPPPSNISSGPSNPPPLGMYPHGYNPSNKEFNPQNSFKQNPIKPPNFQGQYDANANYPSQGQKPLPLNPNQYNHPTNPQRYLSQQPLSHQPQQTPQQSNAANQYQPIHHYPSQQQQPSQPPQQVPMTKVNSHIPQQTNSGGFQQPYGNPYGNNLFQKEANIPPQTNGQQYQGKPPIIQGIQGGQARIQQQNAPANMYLGQLPQGYNQQPQMKQQPPSHMMQMNNSSGSQIRQTPLGNPPINKGPQQFYGENSGNSFPTSSDQVNPPGQKVSEFYQAQQQQQQQAQSAQSISTQVPYPSNSSQYSSSTHSSTQDQKSIPPPPRNAPLPPPGSLNIPSKLTIPSININKMGIQQQQQSFNGDNNYQQQGGSSGQFASNILPPSVKTNKNTDQYSSLKSEKQETNNLQKELQNLPPLTSLEAKGSSQQGPKNTKQSTQSPTVPIVQKVSNQKEGNASISQETPRNSSDSQLKKKLENIEIQNQMNVNKVGSSQKKTPSKELGSSSKDKRDGKSSLKNSSKKETEDSDSLKQKEASNDDKKPASVVFKDPRQLRKLQEQMKKESAKGLADVQFNLLERIEEEDSKNMNSKLLGKRKQQDSGQKMNSSDSIFYQDGEYYDSGVKKFISERDNQKEVFLMRQQSDKKTQISKKTDEKDEPAMLIGRLKQLMMNTKKIPKPANKLEEAERKKSKLEYLKACLVKASSQLLIS